MDWGYLQLAEQKVALGTEWKEHDVQGIQSDAARVITLVSSSLVISHSAAHVREEEEVGLREPSTRKAHKPQFNLRYNGRRRMADWLIGALL